MMGDELAGQLAQIAAVEKLGEGDTLRLVEVWVRTHGGIVFITCWLNGECQVEVCAQRLGTEEDTDWLSVAFATDRDMRTARQIAALQAYHRWQARGGW